MCDIFAYLDDNLFETSSRLNFDISMFKRFTIVGLGAGILNGLSYTPLEGNITVLAPCREFDGLDTGYTRQIYIPNYNTSVGFDGSNIPSAERTICDYLMYRDKLNYHEVLGFIEFYGDDNDWNFSKLYSTAKELGVSRESVDKLISDAESVMGE